MSVSDDNKTIVGSLAGLSVLVFAGLILALLVDTRFTWSSRKKSLHGEVAGMAGEIRSLEARVGQTRKRWEAAIASVPMKEQADVVRQEAEALAEGIDLLEKKKRDLEKEIRVIRGRFAHHRSEYRRQVRGGATGESLGELRTRDGRIFTSAVIREVNGAGMVIQHSHGLARLAPLDLDASWNERFQWSAEEAEIQRQEEQERMKSHFRRTAQPKEARMVAASSGSGGAKKAESATDLQLIEATRGELQWLWNQIQETEAQASVARQQAAESRSRSVPGSLETWEQRANRLEAAARKMRTQYAELLGKLRALSPRESAPWEPGF